MMAIPNPISTVPDNLLIILIVFKLRLFLNFAASITLATSAIIFKAKLIPKIIVLSKTECEVANAVAFKSQNNRMLGLSVLIRNPDMNTFVISLFPKIISTSGSASLNVVFLKNI
jgi:hypothetical protein